MEGKKMLPIGVENFEEIRTEDFYYVDKTGLIRDLLNNKSKVTLFTRPRRFGKSLNMSMLKHFFSVEGDKPIFDGCYDALRVWYDGYRFGGMEMYCPWDVLSHCSRLVHNPKTPPQSYFRKKIASECPLKFFMAHLAHLRVHIAPPVSFHDFAS